MPVSLNWPGTVSGWMSLEQLARARAKHQERLLREAAEEKPEGEEREKELAEAARLARASSEAVEEAAPFLSQLHVRFKTVTQPDLLAALEQQENLDGASYPKRLAADAGVDFAVMRLCLAAVRGVENWDEDEPPNEQLLRALEATTGVSSLIAWAGHRYNRLRPDERAAFFGSAPGGSSADATGAATG